MTNAIMDFVLMGLLIAALWFGVRLDARLKALRSAHEGFAKAVGELDDAAIRAHNSLKELRGHADDSQELLHGRILAARDVLQKLDSQIARAERAGKDIDRSLAAFETARLMPPPPALRPISAPHHAAPVETPTVRKAFDRDWVRSDDTPRPTQPSPRPTPAVGPATGYGARAANAYTSRQSANSVLPQVQPEDDADMLDKVQMSELVVANLNEMIRTLTLPTRQPQPQTKSLEDDLFGADDQ